MYVDDILIVNNNVDAIKTFKLFLDNKFKLEDLDTLKYFLGLEVARIRRVLVYVKGNLPWSCCLIRVC